MALEHPYTWLQSLPPKIHSSSQYYPETEKFIVACLLGICLLIFSKLASRPLATPDGVRESLVPGRHGRLHGLFDIVVESFVKYHDSIIGKENRKYVPLSGAVFIFIFAGNLLGLVPGFPAVTTTVWVNVGIALVVFFAFNIYGIREHGLLGYLKHFYGPIWWLGWLIFVLEVMSTCIRILTLNLRLYWNISADHIVLETFTHLTKIGIPCVFYAFGTFVSFMQAFVFTTLTIVYILLAIQHQEEH
ncbi:MAG: ATP synthase F0 subunit A [Candidatus Dadabacteria bacterium]|nr:MAG: ATP synthase F0 subunit A [Candidatus Dadabacteria bacterium]